MEKTRNHQTAGRLPYNIWYNYTIIPLNSWTMHPGVQSKMHPTSLNDYKARPCLNEKNWPTVQQIQMLIAKTIPQRSITLMGIIKKWISLSIQSAWTANMHHL